MALSLKRKNSRITRQGALHAVVYAFYAAAALIGVTFISQALSYHTYEPHLLWHDGALTLMIVAACLHYRKKNQGFLPMRHAYQMGVIIGVIASLFFAMFMFIYAGFIRPEIVNEFCQHQVTYIQNADMSDIQKVKEMGTLRGVNAFWLANKAFAELLLISVFLPLVLSLLVRKDPVTS